ncbi:MAG: transglycosylase family protein [Actinomycetota bacterium]|nr:transglycosylase family protein [Actinomycetota bacterium]
MAGATAPSAFPTGTLATDFAGIRNCESGGNYALDTGNGYYGAYQFSLATWLGLGETGLPSSAAPAVQDATAYRLYQQAGWGSWPACAAILGLG